uniref:Uncharacterized protein n=1 Tax=Oryza punctata TaxID=4537 RepID=A0A0E0L532_ORYPU
MAARAPSRAWWDAFTTNLKNQGTLVIDKVKALLNREDSAEKLKEVILVVEQQRGKRLATWCREEIAKECWREYLLGDFIPFETFGTADDAVFSPAAAAVAAAAAADHRGGSVLPPGPGDVQVVQTQSTARLMTWGCEALEKIRMEQHQHVESDFQFDDYFDDDVEPSTHDDASSADHRVCPILPLGDFALQSDSCARFAAWTRSAWAHAAAAVDDDDQGSWMKPRIGPLPHAACSPDADHREAASSSSSSRVAAATVERDAHQHEPVATATATSSPDAHQREPASSSSFCVAAADLLPDADGHVRITYLGGGGGND